MRHVDFLPPKETTGIKGLLVLMVLISHLSARVSLFSNGLLGTLFSACGYLTVSMFFFLSGYGIYQRYMQSREAYVGGFLKKRIIPYYAMCCIVILIYLLRDLVFTGTTQWILLLQSFLFGGTIVDMGWYLQAQLLLYILVFLVLRFTGKNHIVWMTFCLALYCAGCALAGLGSTWYEAVPCFALGMLCAKKKAALSDWVRNKAIFKMGAWLALFLVTLWFGNKTVLPESLRIFVKMLSAICFDMLLVMAAGYIRFSNPISNFLGKYSFEIYTMQGMFLYGLRPVIPNDLIYMAAVTAGTILLSLAIHPVFGFADKLVRKTTKVG